MTGSKYLWIISNYNLDIKFHERKDTECTAAELSEASKNILFPRRVAKRLDYNTTIAEIVCVLYFLHLYPNYKMKCMIKHAFSNFMLFSQSHC